MNSTDQPPTMATVARRAGVSPMTVSYTYSQPDRVAVETRRRVLDAARQLDYHGPDPAARSLRRGRVGTIGVVLGEHLTYAFEDPQARRFLAGVASVCRDHGSGLTLIPTGNDAASDTTQIRATAVDGFIIWTTVIDDPALTAAVALGKPVAVHGGPQTAGAHVVSIDNRAAARAIADVAFRGCRRPAILSFPLSAARNSGLVPAPDLNDVTFPVTTDRLRGVYDWCATAGVPTSDLTVAVAARNDRAVAQTTVDALLDITDPPDAILAMSDELALATLDSLATRRKCVPTDVAVTGWDDSPEAERAGLTTVSQSLFDQGQRCAHIALGTEVERRAARWRIEVRATTR